MQTRSQVSLAMEEKQNQILESIQTLIARVDKNTATMEDIKQTLEVSFQASKEATEMAQHNQQKIKDMQVELDKEKLLNAQLSSKLDKTCERLVRLESQSRRDNLLFDGIEECDPNEDCMVTLRAILKDKLKLENADSMAIVRCHRLGSKRADSSKPRTLIAKFHWYGDRMVVWEARQKLKGSNIFINEDFPQEIQQRRQVLRPVMRKAKELNMSASLKVDNLILDGKRYTVADLSQLPTELSPAHVATPQVAEDAVAFFSGQSPLSNFYISPFVISGTTYDCVERFYQKEKAEFHGDQLAALAIMKAGSPLECHRRGRFIDSKWDMTRWRETKAKEVMMTGVSAKFTQSTFLKQFLLYTDKKLIIEANPRDSFWSCGLGLRDPMVASKQHWKGDNVLGDILMQVRHNVAK